MIPFVDDVFGVTVTESPLGGVTRDGFGNIGNGGKNT